MRCRAFFVIFAMRREWDSGRAHNPAFGGSTPPAATKLGFMAEQSKSVEWVKIDQVHPNPENPREISEESFNKLKKSIQEFPEMLTLRPLVVKEGVVLGGNMRLEALKQLGYSMDEGRLHHKISWNYTVPKILREKVKRKNKTGTKT